MSAEWVGLIGMATLVAMIMIRIPVAVALALVGVVGYATLEGWHVLTVPKGNQRAFEIWGTGDKMPNVHGSKVDVQAASGAGVNWLHLNDGQGSGHQTQGIERGIATIEGAIYALSFDYAGAMGFAARNTRIGIYVDGELLLLDTPQNLRRAAFSGEVLDVGTDRDPTDAELQQLAANDFVIGGIERLGAAKVRVVVDKADRGMRDIHEALQAAGLQAVDVREHIVDYDEAFVRVVERHRQQQAALQPKEADQ